MTRCLCRLLPVAPLLPGPCCRGAAGSGAASLNRIVCRSVVLKLLTEKPSPIIITGKRRGCLSYLSYLLMRCAVECSLLSVECKPVYAAASSIGSLHRPPAHRCRRPSPGTGQLDDLSRDHGRRQQRHDAAAQPDGAPAAVAGCPAAAWGATAGWREEAGEEEEEGYAGRCSRGRHKRRWGSFARSAAWGRAAAGNAAAPGSTEHSTAGPRLAIGRGGSFLLLLFSLLAVCWQWEASASLSGRACLCGNTSETCSVGSGQLLLLCDSAILLLCSVECRQYSCKTASSLTSRRLSCQVREH